MVYNKKKKRNNVQSYFIFFSLVTTIVHLHVFIKNIEKSVKSFYMLYSRFAIQKLASHHLRFTKVMLLVDNISYEIILRLKLNLRLHAHWNINRLYCWLFIAPCISSRLWWHDGLVCLLKKNACIEKHCCQTRQYCKRVWGTKRQYNFAKGGILLWQNYNVLLFSLFMGTNIEYNKKFRLPYITDISKNHFIFKVYDLDISLIFLFQISQYTDISQ